MTVQLSLLGAPSVRRPGDERPLNLALRDGAMLAWLALVGPTSRAQMASLLWHGHEEDQARNSLRQRLFQLRRQVGEDIVIGHATLQLSPNVEHDLDAGWALLGSQGLPECPAMDGWIMATRAQRDREQRTSLISRLDSLESSSDWAAALPLAQVLVHIEPLSEQAHRRLMRLHAQLGDAAGALRAYAQCEQRLREGLGMKPEAATVSLRQSIAQGAPLAATGSVTHNSQLPALSPPAMTLARLLALAKDGFSIELAEFVLQRHILQLADAWRELESLRVIRGSSFVRDEHRQTLLEELPDTIAAHVLAQIAAFRARASALAKR